METYSTPSGGRSVTGPEMSVTSAPRSRAASAMAKPILPEERLLKKRTGSIISRVGPAVTSTRRPANSRGGTSSFSTAATICSGSTMRPTSSSPQARCPRAGPAKRAPQRERRSTLRWLARQFHMAAFIAGASRMGQRMAMKAVESKSSAMPLANLPSALAVAGATTNNSAHLASEIWAILLRAANISRHTGLPLSVSSVNGAMNSQACAVMTTRTSAPRFFKMLTTSAAL